MVAQGELWLMEPPNQKRRPVLIVSRDEVIPVVNNVIVAPVTSTIRERNAIRRRISALSAEGKISGVVLGGLPFALAIVIMFLNPTYLMELLDSTMGIAMIIGGLVAMVIGIFWMRRITNLKF